MRDTRRTRRWTLAPLLLAAGAALGCGNKLDEAAKARVLRPEDPPPDVQRAAQALDIDDAATDGALWDRLWRMDRLEVTRRIGAHKAHGTVHFKWTLGDRAVELTETQALETDASGQFHASVMNDQDTGFEFIWTGAKAYAKARYGAYHERRIDRAQQDSIRDQATSALPTVYELFQHRLHASIAGDGRFAGRDGTRFTLALGSTWGPKATSEPPAPVYGLVRDGEKGELHPGPDADTARRLAFLRHEEPEKVYGEILVDRTGVILKANLRARFKMAEESRGSPAILELDLSYELEPKAVAIAPPKDVVALKLPHAVNDPLWFLRSAPAAAAHDEEEERESRLEDSAADDAAPVHPPTKAGAASKTTPSKRP